MSLSFDMNFGSPHGRDDTDDFSAEDSASFRDELDRLRRREQEIMELLGTESPERIIHDLRNLINEVQLLRVLAEDKM